MLHQKTCKHCGQAFDYDISGNDIYFCPYCKKATDCVCDYGFGPITPCTVWLGPEPVAEITGWHQYILSSQRFGFTKLLKGGYADLAVYTEATEIIARCINDGEPSLNKDVHQGK